MIWRKIAKNVTKSQKPEKRPFFLTKITRLSHRQLNVTGRKSSSSELSFSFSWTILIQNKKGAFFFTPCAFNFGTCIVFLQRAWKNWYINMNSTRSNSSPWVYLTGNHFWKIKSMINLSTYVFTIIHAFFSFNLKFHLLRQVSLQYIMLYFYGYNNWFYVVGKANFHIDEFFISMVLK